MSEDVHYKGKLKPTDMSAEEFMEHEHKDHGEGWALPSGYESYDEWLLDTHHESAVIIDDLVYLVDKSAVVETQDIFKAVKNEDGSYDFEVKYYNGGCGFNEAIESAVDV